MRNRVDEVEISTGVSDDAVMKRTGKRAVWGEECGRRDGRRSEGAASAIIVGLTTCLITAAAAPVCGLPEVGSVHLVRMLLVGANVL